MYNIKYLVMDVDGTLTDGKIYMGNQGEVFKAFNIKDGCGINDVLRQKGIEPIIITGRESEIVLNRCKELKITRVYQGIHDKLNTVAYIGDDINDLSCMIPIKEAGGLVGCPKDAANQVLAISDYVAEHNGGDGAVRDFIEWIVRSEV